MQILSKDGELGGREGGPHHVIWIPVFFLPFLFLFLTQNFFFFLVKKKDYRYTFPPSSSWPSCAGFRQIYFSKHLWTLGESRSLFAKGAFCSKRFWIMPYQAATILTRALERWGGGVGVEGVNSLLLVRPLSAACDPPASSSLCRKGSTLHFVCLVLSVVLVV